MTIVLNFPEDIATALSHHGGDLSHGSCRAQQPLAGEDAAEDRADRDMIPSRDALDRIEDSMDERKR
jgi:hypothetical protein